MTEQSLNCLGKTPELKDKSTMLVMVGRSAGRSYFRREVGIGSRSQKVLDDCIGHASGNENISFHPLFMIHNDIIGHLIRHFSMENHYKLS